MRIEIERNWRRSAVALLCRRPRGQTGEFLCPLPLFSFGFAFGIRVLWVEIYFLDLYRNHLALAHALIPMLN
jgi:hypothetical protein